MLLHSPYLSPQPPMDPPPLAAAHLNHPDSVDSSPRSHDANDPLPAVPGARLRLMCSFGGHIMPRPHDKSLCYVGGETRLVAVDRHCSLSAFCARLSGALLNGRAFTLKYQLPNEDLDSLVSVATDEDLENFMDEYDRLNSTSGSSSRIRLFIFVNKPDSTVSMGPLLNDAKSETWFVDALNGSGLIHRGDSDSAAMDTLMNGENFGSHDGGEEHKEEAKSNEVQYSLPESPMLEKDSSFDSSPSMSNLPPIRVRVDQDGVDNKVLEQRIEMEEQFAQLSFATSNICKHDDGYVPVVVPPLLPHPTTVMITSAGGSSDNLNRILSDDERSDQGVPVAFRRPPLPLQPVQQKACGAYNLPSPDSVASDSSISSANSLSKHMYYQEQAHLVSKDSRAAISANTNSDTNSGISTSQIQTQQVQDSYPLASQLDQPQQQQYMHASLRYIPHHTATPAQVPMSSYYQVYAHPPSQQQLHHHADHQQYPSMYVMPVTQMAKPQPYMSMQSNTTGVMAMKSNATDATSTVASSHPLTSPSPSFIAASAGYKETIPPIYPTNIASTLAKPEMVGTVYRTAVASTPQVVQVPQSYLGFSQMQQHPPQSIAITPAAAASYGYEYPNPAQDHVYYSQHQAAPPLPAQYQTMAQAAALAEVTKQIPHSDSSNQNIRVSQPL